LGELYRLLESGLDENDFLELRELQNWMLLMQTVGRLLVGE